MMNPDKIRLEMLPQPFIYKRMVEVKEERQARPDQPHRHDYYVVIYVEKARGSHQIDFLSHDLTDHTLYFISPEQIHFLKVEGTPQGHVLPFTVDFVQQLSLGRKQLFELEFFFNCDEAQPVFVPEDWRADLNLLLVCIEKECRVAHP